MEQRSKVRGLTHDRNVAKVTLVEVLVGQVSRSRSSSRSPGRHQRRHDASRTSATTSPPVVLGLAKEALLDRSSTGFASHLRRERRQVSIVGAGIKNAPGYAARMFGALADAG